MTDDPKRAKLLQMIDILIAGAEKARLAGDAAASIDLAMHAAQYIKLAKQFEEIDRLLKEGSGR